MAEPSEVSPGPAAQRSLEGVRQGLPLSGLGQVISQAVETLGTLEKARRWMSTPNRALGGVVPLDRLDTTVGAQQVEEILLRLTYGIQS